MNSDGNNINPVYKGNLLHKINYLSCIYIITWTLVPVFRSITNQSIFMILFAGIVGVWLLTSFMMSRKWITELVMVSLFASLYIAIMLLYYIFGIGTIQMNGFVKPLFLFIYSYMGFFYTRYGNAIIIKRIILVTGICFILTSLTTCYNLTENINVVRMMTSSSSSPDITRDLERKNIAAYDFIYGTIIILPLFIIGLKRLLLNKGKYSKAVWKRKLIFLLSSILAILVVVLSNFTTAYLLLILAVGLSFMPAKKTINRTLLLNILIVLLLSPLIYYGLLFVFETIKANIPSIRTQVRIEGIINIMKGSSDIDSLTIRKTLFENSLRSFISSPFIGVGAYYGGTNEIIGSHAQFMDDLGRYGIVGTLPIFVYMYYVLKRLFKSIRDQKIRIAYFYSSILFIILGFLNPIQSYGIMFSTFFGIPVFSNYLDELCRG